MTDLGLFFTVSLSVGSLALRFKASLRAERR